MASIFINDIKVTLPEKTTILQACDEIGIDVPRFCFHERLLVAGNCRMCLVEVEKTPKPVPSCTMTIADVKGKRIYTKTPLVKKAQESVLEFLLTLIILNISFSKISCVIISFFFVSNITITQSINFSNCE